MLALFAFIVFVTCAVLAYTKLLLGAIVAFTCPILVGVLIWFMLRNPVMDTFDDRAFLALMFMGLIVIVELGLFVGGLLRLV